MAEYDDDIEIVLRPLPDLAARMTILIASGFRLILESGFVQDSEDETYSAETERFEYLSWLRATFDQAISEDERVVLSTPVGELTEVDIDTHAFDSEAGLAIAWTLGLVDTLDLELPPQAAIESLQELVPRPWDRADKLNKRLATRTEEEVWRVRDHWYLIRLRGLCDDIDHPTERMSLMKDILADARLSGFPIRNDDLSIGGTRFSSLTQDAQSVLLGTADAYIKALTWCCGLGTSWDDVPIDEV